MKLIPALHWGIDLEDFLVGFHVIRVTIGQVNDPDSYHTHTAVILGLGLVTFYWTSAKQLKENT
jgi:hypothetical protein